MENLIRILMRRDRVSRADAIEIIQGSVDEFPNDPEEALHDLGLEPDYLFDILPFYKGTIL